jgi:hypothetical protein
MYVRIRTLRRRWPVALLLLATAGLAALWPGSGPSAPDFVRPAAFVALSTSADRAAEPAHRRRAAPQPDFAPDGPRRVLRVMLLYGMGGRPMGSFK